jgi:hypothetical protein
MATRQYRLNEFEQGAPLTGLPVEFYAKIVAGLSFCRFPANGKMPVGTTERQARRSRLTFLAGALGELSIENPPTAKGVGWIRSQCGR